MFLGLVLVGLVGCPYVSDADHHARVDGLDVRPLDAEVRTVTPALIGDCLPVVFTVAGTVDDSWARQILDVVILVDGAPVVPMEIDAVVTADAFQGHADFTFEFTLAPPARLPECALDTPCEHTLAIGLSALGNEDVVEVPPLVVAPIVDGPQIGGLYFMGNDGMVEQLAAVDPTLPHAIDVTAYPEGFAGVTDAYLAALGAVGATEQNVTAALYLCVPDITPFDDELGCTKLNGAWSTHGLPGPNVLAYRFEPAALAPLGCADPDASFDLWMGSSGHPCVSGNWYKQFAHDLRFVDDDCDDDGVTRPEDCDDFDAACP
jgi:hypothetical protein